MDRAANTTGQQQFACSGFSVSATVDDPPKKLTDPTTGSIYLSAQGPGSNGNVSMKADGRVSSSVDECHVDVVSSGIVLDAGDKGNIGACRNGALMQHIELQGNGGNVVLENGQLPLAPKIEIKADAIVMSVGLNKITIGPTGITISGLEVNLKATAVANVEAAQVTVKGSVAATVQSGAMTTIKGGVVMIN